MTGPTDSSVTSRQAGAGGKVPSQCRKGRRQARSSLGNHWPSPSLGIAHLKLGTQA